MQSQLYALIWRQLPTLMNKSGLSGRRSIKSWLVTAHSTLRVLDLHSQERRVWLNRKSKMQNRLKLLLKIQRHLLKYMKLSNSWKLKVCLPLLKERMTLGKRLTNRLWIVRLRFFITIRMLPRLMTLLIENLLLTTLVIITSPIQDSLSIKALLRKLAQDVALLMEMSHLIVCKLSKINNFVSDLPYS